MSEEGGRPTACPVCPRHCALAPGELGRCRARRNRRGEVVSESYGHATSLALDPVEKKPLARFMPGALVLSVGSYGCNLSCPFCQNAEISQVGGREVPWRALSPEGLVGLACDLRARDGRVAGVAFTYNEPLVGWEYVRDASALAHERGLASVLVSNGCAEPWVIGRLLGLIDAANVDLKGFSEGLYEACGGAPGSLGCVRETIEALADDPACHLEVTTLVVPGMNDKDDEVEAIARWLSGLAGGRGGSEVAYHVTRFFPRWRMADARPTLVGDVRRLAAVASRHLDHVYVGNC